MMAIEHNSIVIEKHVVFGSLKYQHLRIMNRQMGKLWGYKATTMANYLDLTIIKCYTQKLSLERD
jgi:hypothetical protein